ncbi:UbiX family flavin prenyltransferase [bacterium]|nr:UbiX family flavin prenyltransferase [bacterium]
MVEVNVSFPRKLVVGVGGASGAPYAKRLLDHLAAIAPEIEVGVVFSKTARGIWAQEVGTDPRDLPFPVFGPRDFGAPFASGSAGWRHMIVVPASMGGLARIAHGISDDLLTRAADVVIKERGTLIVVPRETPFSEIHLENMLRLARAGAFVVPASPSFYARPTTIDELVDTLVARLLDRLGIENDLMERWGFASSRSEAPAEETL